MVEPYPEGINTVAPATYTPPPRDAPLGSPFFNNFDSVWFGLHGKPYITVSAKGIANGLSDIPNDGADFGPDTPGTQTSGIYEAVQYSYGSLNSPNVPIKLMPGRYKISPNATLYQINTSAPYTGKPEYAIIPVPTVNFSTTNAIQNISIHGSGALANGGGIYHNLDGAEGMTIIDVSEVPAPAGETVMTFGWDRSVNSSGTNSIDIGDFVILQATPKASGDNIVGGLDFTTSNNSRATNISIYSPNNHVSTVFPSSDEIGISIDAEYGDECWVDEVSVYCNYLGASFGPHAHVGTYISQSNYIGLFPSTKHGVDIARYDTVGCIYHIYNPSGDSSVRIFLMDGEDYSANSSSFNQTIADIYVGGSSFGYYPKIEIENFRMDYAYGSPNPRLPIVQVNATPYPFYFNIKHIESQPPSVAGTTAGTVQPYVLEYGTNYKKIIFQFDGYENDTTTDQTIGYPANGAPHNNSLAFSSYAVITANNTGLTISATTTGITITAPDSTTTYSGIVIVEGY